MSADPVFPGVFIEEISGGVHPIPGVSTAVTGFIGAARSGPINRAARIQSFSEYERTFGGLAPDSEMSYSVRQFFLNGGADAWVVRLAKDAAAASRTLQNADEAPVDVLLVRALGPGIAGNSIQLRITYDPAGAAVAFNLDAIDTSPDAGSRSESFSNLTLNPADERYVETAVNGTSQVITVKVLIDQATVDAGSVAGFRPKEIPDGILLEGGDESPLSDADAPGLFVGDRSQREGIYAFDSLDLVNVLCLPGVSDPGILAAADSYCQERRMFMIVDAPKDVSDPESMRNAMSGADLPKTEYGAVYYPWLNIPDPLDGGNLRRTAPSGTIAGLYARIDNSRGVWKAPAGTEASLAGVQGVDHTLNAFENATLNVLGVNCIRMFPEHGVVAWGARTLRGADEMASEFKFVPVRRFTLFVEDSVSRGTKWAVFEPNAEPLWAELRLNVGAFMHGLFQQGAFQGRTPREAYFVKCDRDTVTQDEIALGVVNIVIGFAPVRPAEFVIIKIQQLAGKPQDPE